MGKYNPKKKSKGLTKKARKISKSDLKKQKRQTKKVKKSPLRKMMSSSKSSRRSKSNLSPMSIASTPSLLHSPDTSPARAMGTFDPKKKPKALTKKPMKLSKSYLKENNLMPSPVHDPRRVFFKRPVSRHTFSLEHQVGRSNTGLKESQQSAAKTLGQQARVRGDYPVELGQPLPPHQRRTTSSNRNGGLDIPLSPNWFNSMSNNEVLESTYK